MSKAASHNVQAAHTPAKFGEHNLARVAEKPVAAIHCETNQFPWCVAAGAARQRSRKLGGYDRGLVGFEQGWVKGADVMHRHAHVHNVH
eukprot:scaffold311030_cov33-Prasinocladus_malaysianus.AAC.1